LPNLPETTQVISPSFAASAAWRLEIGQKPSALFEIDGMRFKSRQNTRVHGSPLFHFRGERRI
jgi:hypothetical protein